MKQHTSLRVLVAVSAAALVAACGGGGGGESLAAPAPVALVPGTSVPLAATTNATEASAFVSTLVAAGGNGGEPLVLTGVVLATSETAEPRPV